MNIKKNPQSRKKYFRFEFLNLVVVQAGLNIVQLQVNQARGKSLTESLFLLTSASLMLIREVSSKVAGQELSDEKNTIGKHGIIIMLPVTQ